VRPAGSELLEAALWAARVPAYPGAVSSTWPAKGVQLPDARKWEDASAAEARSYEGEQEERKLALSMCPFRFRWQESDGQFFRYPDEYSRQLNIAYEQGESATVLKSVVRFLSR
jgi:hypothetical protein